MRRPSVRPGRFKAVRTRFSSSGDTVGLAEAFPLAPRPLKPGANALLNHRALELRENSHHLEQRLAWRCRGVEALLMQEEIGVQ